MATNDAKTPLKTQQLGSSADVENSRSRVDEDTPTEHSVHGRQQSELQKKRTPLPKLQLLLIYSIQLGERITAHVITPFVNQLVRDTGITKGNETQTGYYAGFISSTFYLTEALTVFHWGWASDRFGRRPILLLGPFGLTIAMFCFGLSQTFASLVVFRALQGICNGNIGVSKTVLAELSDETNIADSFALMPVMWSLGSTIGPSMGGLLSEPAKRWPDIFGRIAFFHEYPYFLPCAVAGSYALLTAVSAFFGLKETLPSLVARKRVKKTVIPGDSEDSETALLNESVDPGYGATTSTNSPPDTDPNPKPTEDDRPATMTELLIPQILLPLVVYIFQAFSDLSHQVLLPLVYSTSIANGGLGMEAFQIGTILAVFGVLNLLIQVTLLAWFVRRYGTRNVQIVAHACYFLTIALYPLLNNFAKRAGRVDGWVWFVIVLQLGARLTNGMAYGSINIIIVNSAPRRSALGATNGLAQLVGNVTRAIAPTFAASLFAYSRASMIAGGNLVYIIISIMSICGFRLTFMLPKST